jgi:uncharacterized membrane protein YdbT with pleckstrin-like domain
MSYVERNLIPGEKLVYRTGVHWSILFWPGILAATIASAGIAVLVHRSDIAIVGIVLLVLAVSIFGYSVYKKNATEIAVTDRRVIIKTGMMSRRSLEIMLAKVESIGIDEPVLGRILGYGTVVIHGTGGTPEPFSRIAHPSEFRREVQQQIGTQR